MGDPPAPHFAHVSREALIWFESKLSEERSRLAELHTAWIHELGSKFDSMAVGYVADNGAVPDSSQITPASSKAPAGGGVTEAAVVVVPSKKSTAAPGGMDDGPLPQDFFGRLVHDKRFECGFGILIIVNFAVMAVGAQYRGLGVGNDIGYLSFDEPRETVWPGASEALDVMDICFGVLYTIELLSKVLGLRLRFFDAWNLLDAFIMVMWYVGLFATNIELPIDTMLLRLLRLIKLLRLLKLARKLSGFAQVYMLVTALRGCATMLFYASVVLSACLASFALLFNQVLVSYVILQGGSSDRVKLTCFKYFGTFSRSLFSMFELTLGNWVPIGRFLIDDVSEFFVIFSIVFKLTFGFALVAVINGCFIKETFKVAENDDLLMIMAKEKERKTHHVKMMKLLDAADATGDGTLTKDEFEAVCQIPDVNKWLGAQGLRVKDAAELFEVLDDGGGILSKEELISGVSQLKGFARSLDLAFSRKRAEERSAELERILGTMAAAQTNLGDGHKVLVDKQATMVDRVVAAIPQQPAVGAIDYSQQLAKLAGDVAEIKTVVNNKIGSALPTAGLPMALDARNMKMQESSAGGKAMNWGCS